MQDERDRVLDGLEPSSVGGQLGHVAGGLDRHGRDFFTIYFGVEGRA